MRFWFRYLGIVKFLCILLFHGNNSTKTIKMVPKGKIVGGKMVDLKMFPSAVLFLNLGAQCAGSILNTWSILTAAHCFDINKNTDYMEIAVGARYLFDFEAKEHAVKSFVPHEKYNVTAIFSCDIAIIFVETPIELGPKVQKSILVNNDVWMRNKAKPFQVIGWGWTKYGGSVSQNGLLMAELEFVSSEKCSELHQLHIGREMFCLYGDGTQDSCRGDSGGGVFFNDMLVGITSHGDGCAKKNKPSVYTNVLYFRKWIEQEVLKYFTNNCSFH